MSTDGDSTLSNTIDKLVPVTSDGNPIIWTDDNDAHIEGLLHEVGKFYKRTGRFQSFFKQRATVLSNGKLAVDSLECVSFIANKIKDGYSFENPCPPTAERVTAYDVARRTTGTPVHGNKTLPTLTEIPDELKDTTVLSEHAVELEDSKLLTSLTHVFKYGKRAAAAGKSHRFLRDAATVESGPRCVGHQVECRRSRRGRVGSSG
jgi:hypothetical protein